MKRADTFIATLGAYMVTVHRRMNVITAVAKSPAGGPSLLTVPSQYKGVPLGLSIAHKTQHAAFASGLGDWDACTPKIDLKGSESLRK